MTRGITLSSSDAAPAEKVHDSVMHQDHTASDAPHCRLSGNASARMMHHSETRTTRRVMHHTADYRVMHQQNRQE